MHTQSFLIGSYASPEEKGLFCCAFSPETGFSMKKEYDGLLNPSFLLEHPDHPVLYTVEETDDGAVCAWQEKEDRLILLNKVSTGGASPCHLSLSEDGR